MGHDEDSDSRPPRRRDDAERRDRDRHRESRHRDDRRDGHRTRSRSRDGRRSRTPDSSRRRRDDRRDRDRGEDVDRHRRRRRSRDGRDPERGSRRARDDNDDDDRSGHSREAKRGSLRNSGPLPSQEDSFAIVKGEQPEQPKEKANYGTTGFLAAASNSVAQADGSSIVLKYHEPPEARKPSARDQWKLFVFKGPDIVDTIDLSLRSCWLIGRDAAVADLPAEHPSISKQHAVVQFRYTEKRNEFGDKIGRVKPYLIDLESANGTSLNGDKVPDSRYLELRDKDMVQFGQSTREYVIMLAPRD